MSVLSLASPFPIFTDIDGNPLEDGYIYVGTAGLNAETNPISAYWDSALTVPAAQPIRTLGGYPSRSGSAARLYVDADDCSIIVKNKNGSLIFSALNQTERLSSGLITFVQAGTGAVSQSLQTRGRKIIYDTDFSTVQQAIDYCLSFGASAPVLEITQLHALTSALIIDRPTSDPASSRGKFVIRGQGANCGFSLFGANVYMFNNSIAGYSENVVFDNIWFQSDHSDNAGAGYTGVIKGEDFIRISFNDCYFQEIGVEPACSTYLQSFYLTNCKFVSWNGPIMDCLAFYDLSVIGCQFESGNYAGSKGFSAFDGTATQSTQKATFVSNLYENCQGPFVSIQTGRGVVVTGNYFEANVDQVLDFQQGIPKGVFVTGNSFDTSGSAATYAPILVSYPNGFFGSGNFSTTRLYRFLNEMAFSGNSQGGSWGQGDRTESGELLSSTGPITTSTRIPSKMQVFRSADESQGLEVIGDGGAGNSVDSVNTGSATYLPLALRQRNNSTTRNNVVAKADGTVAINMITSGVTLDENLTAAFWQASGPGNLRISVRGSDGVTRSVDLVVV